MTSNVWHHAAATYDGSVWRIYLDGNLDSHQQCRRGHAAVGFDPARLARHVARTRRASPSGFFAGVLDEARIWNVARSGAQIQAAMNTQIGVPRPVSCGRWGMNESAGHECARHGRAERDGNDLRRTDVGDPGAPFAGQGTAPDAPSRFGAG